MKQTIAIYPGTFDPLTNGHLSILNRTLKIFDKVIIAILVNPKKTPLFSLEERIDMIKMVLGNKENVEIDSFQGLLVEYAVSKGANVIVRGMRAMSDFEFEFQLALMNRKLNREVESVFMMTDYKWLYTSSTIIKEAASLNGNISGLVPPVVCARLKEKYGYKI
jgi:pantetheine-phosphate adenylyltransferase